MHSFISENSADKRGRIMGNVVMGFVALSGAIFSLGISYAIEKQDELTKYPKNNVADTPAQVVEKSLSQLKKQFKRFVEPFVAKGQEQAQVKMLSKSESDKPR